MIQRPIPEDGSALEKIQKEFETWRNNRKKRGRLPKALWEAAVSLSKDYSLGRISTALRLNYRELKRRVEVRNSKKNSEPDSTTHFIEVNMKEMIPSVECTVEMEDKSGAKMKMLIRGDVDFVNLARTFWEKSR